MHRIDSLLLLEKIVERPRIRRERQRFAVLFGELDNAGPALRRLHHTADRRHARFHEGARHDFVGGDHEILDQFTRAILLPGRDALNLAIGDYSLWLDTVEIERT